jgi:hypothetical protein
MITVLEIQESSSSSAAAAAAVSENKMPEVNHSCHLPVFPKINECA